ncbi:MAG: LysR family transcriptional regulator [Gammaproteobacteria bacterium]|nr:LysR family transcriptional regulator [Gammaproteobacteria bacterium]
MTVDIADLNLKHLAAVQACIKLGTLARAAEALHISQPALTQAIAKLESQWGFKLFSRHRGGVTPTAEGLVVNRRLDNALDILQDALDRVKSKTVLTGLRMTQLQALVSLRQHHSFSGAAQALGIQQSAVHRVARELEARIGQPLFNANASGITLTTPAQTLARAAAQAFYDLSQIRASLLDSHVIRLGAMPLARASWLPRALNQFTQDYPDVEVQVIDAPYSDLLDHLHNAELDLILGALRPDDPPQLVQKQFFSTGLCVVGRADHPLNHRNRYADFDWIVARQGSPTRAAFEHLFENRSRPRVIEVSSNVLIRELLLNNDRLTLISPIQLQSDIDNGRLATLSPELPNTRRPIGLTYRQNWQRSEVHSAFIAALTAHIPDRMSQVLSH